MKLVIFGLSISSSWGNGHAALWRGLVNSLLRSGHSVTFFERNTPWYAAHRDLAQLPGSGDLVIYNEDYDLYRLARKALSGADAAIVTSYCPDGRSATRLILQCNVAVRCFYDLDTPVTLARLQSGDAVAYLPPEGLGVFDLVLSYTGGKALDLLRTRLGARRVVPLYGSVDPAVHSPAAPSHNYAASLSYLGTYASDRQSALERLFLVPARQRPLQRFVIAGAQYPDDFPWEPNICFVRHLPPAEHAAFYSSSRLTLNVTRPTMAALGWCPSGRLFEAAACGTPIVTDSWNGLASFFNPGSEILVASSTTDVLATLELSDETLRTIAIRARERALSEHTASQRAREMIVALESAMHPEPAVGA